MLHSPFYLNLDASPDNNCDFTLYSFLYLFYIMDSSKEDNFLDDSLQIPVTKDDNNTNEREKSFSISKATKKNRSPEFSIDSLILRKRNDNTDGKNQMSFLLYK